MNPDRTESSSTSSLSLPNGKREREEGQENERNTRRRTGEYTEIANEVKEVERVVLDELCNANRETVWKSLEKLWKDLLHDQDNRKRKQKLQAFYEVCGHAFVAQVMHDHQNDRRVQVHGMCVITEATYKTAFLRSPIGKVRGIQAILAAMKNFPVDQDIISNGFCALYNLTCGNDASKEHCDLLVTKSGQLPFLIERMKDFSQNRLIVGNCCCLLWNLCQFPQLKSGIIKAKSVTALGTALESHEEDERIQERARQALYELIQP